MEDCESVAVEIDHAEEVDEAEEVDQRTWGGVHEDDCEDEDIEGVEVAVSKRIVGAVFALMADLCILLVCEVGLEDLYEEVS